MPVIGRLDKQVEEILIRPAAAARAPEGEATRAGAPERPATCEPAATDATEQDDSAQTSREDERARRRDALPVWLL